MPTLSPKNIILLLILLFFVWGIFIYLTLAYSGQSLVINPPPGHKALWAGGWPEYSISVGGQSRILRVSYEGDNLILRFFKDDNARLEFLGEEIFDKDGVKIYDSYLENNGLWPKGYELRYRR